MYLTIMLVIMDRRYFTDCLSIIKLVNRQMQLSRQVRHVANEIAVTGPLQLNNMDTNRKNDC